MSNQLYTVERSDGPSKAFLLSSGSTLSFVRKQLIVKQFMIDSDSFMRNEEPLERSREPEIRLSELVKSGTTISIGTRIADIAR